MAPLNPDFSLSPVSEGGLGLQVLVLFSPRFHRAGLHSWEPLRRGLVARRDPEPGQQRGRLEAEHLDPSLAGGGRAVVTGAGPLPHLEAL